MVKFLTISAKEGSGWERAVSYLPRNYELFKCIHTLSEMHGRLAEGLSRLHKKSQEISLSQKVITE